jgi:hypothetical protein
MDIVANFLWIFVQVCILITEGTIYFGNSNRWYIADSTRSATEGMIYCGNANGARRRNERCRTNTCLYFNRNAGKKGNMDIHFLPSENCCYLKGLFRMSFFWN